MKHDKIVLLAKTKLNSIDQKNTFFFFCICIMKSLYKNLHQFNSTIIIMKIYVYDYNHIVIITSERTIWVDFPTKINEV